MNKLENHLQPLTYRKYLPALWGMWLIAFALGIWFGKSVAGLAWPILIIGLVVHAISMRAAHRPHR